MTSDTSYNDNFFLSDPEQNSFLTNYVFSADSRHKSPSESGKRHRSGIRIRVLGCGCIIFVCSSGFEHVFDQI